MITACQAALPAQKDPERRPLGALPEFPAWAEENPDLAYGPLSPESRTYMEQIAQKDGLAVDILPLKDGGEMLNALLGEQVALALSEGIHKKCPDQLEMIAAPTTFRHASGPDIPRMDGEGYDLATDSRTTLILPKGAPARSSTASPKP